MSRPPLRPRHASALPCFDDLRLVIGHTLGVPSQMLRPQTALAGNLPHFDSRALGRLAAALEHRYGIVLADEDCTLSHFATVASVAALVSLKLEE